MMCPYWMGFVFLFFSIPSFARELHLEFKKSENIIVPSFILQKIKEDAPLIDVTSNGNKIFWILGQKKIWEWNMETSKMRIFSLRKLEDPAKSLKFNGESLLIETIISIFQIHLKEQKMNLIGKASPPIELPSNLEISDVIYSTTFSNHQLIVTPFKIFSFKNNSLKPKIIPNMKKVPLVAAYATQDINAYLFQDNILEIYTKNRSFGTSLAIKAPPIKLWVHVFDNIFYTFIMSHEQFYIYQLRR